MSWKFWQKPTQKELNQRLFDAVKKKNIKKIRKAVQAGADVSAPDSKGWPVLHQAAIDNAVELVSELLKIPNINPDLRTLKWGSTPLIIAAAHGYDKIVRLLINAGADVNKKSLTGETPLGCAIYSVFTSTSLYTNFSGLDSSAVKTVKMLLQAGADVNASNNSDNDTALMRAASISHGKVFIPILLKAGADINRQNKRSLSALMCAIKGGWKQNVDILLENKANINAVDTDGKTPLTIAAASSRPVITAKLIKAGADVNTKDNNGNTPLMKAGDTEVCQQLIFAGADVNAQNNDGDTVLMCHISCLEERKNVPETVQVLLNAGADFTVRNNKNQTMFTLLKQNYPKRLPAFRNMIRDMIAPLRTLPVSEKLSKLQENPGFLKSAHGYSLYKTLLKQMTYDEALKAYQAVVYNLTTAQKQSLREIIRQKRINSHTRA